MKKRIISGLMALVMVLSLLPSGVFTAFAAEAENGEDGVPEDRIDYSELTENQYMSKVLLNSNYCGAANGWSTEEYVNSLQVQLGYYLKPMRAGPEVNLTESLQANRAFMASVGAWKVLTFDPGNITDDMLTEKDYYTAIIFNILDVQFNDNKFLELLNNDYGQMSRETMSIAVEIAEKFDNIDINKLNAKLDDSTKSEFINLLVERIPKENDKAFCESFGKGMTFVTTSLKTLNSVEEIAKTLSSYVLLAQLGNEVKGVLYALYQNCDSSNMAMKTALLETYTVCSDSLNAAIVGVIETGTQVFNTTFSAVVGTTWKACISAAANGFASWLLISQTIGKTISNF